MCTSTPPASQRKSPRLHRNVAQGRNEGERKSVVDHVSNGAWTTAHVTTKEQYVSKRMKIGADREEWIEEHCRSVEKRIEAGTNKQT